MENASVRPEVDPTARDTARTAWTLGLLAIGLTLMIPCSAYLSALAALPVGLAAVARTRSVLDNDVTVDEATEVYARTGRILGLMSAGVSGVFLLLVLSILALYAVMFASIFGMALALPPPPVP